MANTIANTTFNTIAQRAGLGENCTAQVNVGEAERVASVVTGGALVGFGLTCRGLAGIALPIAGGILAIRGLSGHCSIYSALGIDGSKLDRPDNPNAAISAGNGVRIETSISINRSPQDLYDVWRGLERLPEFMTHLCEVRNTIGTQSHWVAEGPFGLKVEWDAEIINERPYEMLAWKSLPGSDVDTAGSVHFESFDNGRGTVLRVNLKYDPPAGNVGIAIAKLFGQDPEAEIKQNLARFKELMEQEQMTEMWGGP